MQSIVAPDKVSAGGTVEVEFEVINQGTAATNVPNWTDNVYLSLDNKISSDDIVLDTVDNGSALKPGESYKSFAESIVIPKRFRGDAYLIVQADNKNQVNELPQENNNTQFKQIKVEFESSGTGGSGQPSDLVTSNVVAPIQAFEGSTIEVRYKVTNKGIDKTDVNSWQDTIWLTKDKNRPSATSRNAKPGEVEDILLKTIPHTGELAVGEEYEQIVQVKIPSQTTGEWYITPWSDTFDVVLEDTFDININPDDPNELDSNNYKARPITLLLTPPPDLVVNNVSSTSEAKGGEPFEVSWTVKNQGAGATTDNQWTDKVYLSDSPTPDAPGSKRWDLGNFVHNGSLASGESYTQTASFDLSPAAAGKYVIIDTNAGSPKVWEGPYTKNNIGTTDTNVTNNPADLVVKSVNLPETSDSGEVITVEWSVENQGAPMWSGTKYWYDEVWISKDPTFIKNRATNVGSYIHTADTLLGTGDTYTQSQNIRLPAGVDGEYYVYVSTDFSYLTNSGDRSGSLSLGNRNDNDNSRKKYVGRGFEDPSNNFRQQFFTRSLQRTRSKNN